MKRSARQRRGFVTLVAIALLGLVATALVMLNQLTFADARRSSAERIDAQLRLLLLAGIRQATPASDASGEVATTPIATPVDGATLSLAASAVDAERVVTVTATLGDRSASQTLRYSRDANRWRLVAAELSPAQRTPLGAAGK